MLLAFSSDLALSRQSPYTDIKERLLTDWCNVIMASTEEECDKLYDEMVADIHDLGVDQLTAAQQEAYTLNQSKLDGSYWNK